MRRGVTLQEVLITVVIGFVILGAFVFGFGKCFSGVSGLNKSRAEEGAAEYARELGLKTSSVSCASTDTDGDGYVSCTLVVQQPSGETRLEPIECAATFTINSGCRVQKQSFGGPR